MAAALLSERDPLRPGPPATREAGVRTAWRSRSDLLDRVQVLRRDEGGEGESAFAFDRRGLQHVRRVAQQLQGELAAARIDAVSGEPPAVAGSPAPVSPAASELAASGDRDQALLLRLLEAFPDRLALLRPGSRDRAVMVGGRGVRIDPASRVAPTEFFLGLDVHDGPGDARVRMASQVDRAWLDGQQIETRDELFYNPSREQVEARRRRYWLDLLIDETPTSIDDAPACGGVLAEALAGRLHQVLPGEETPAYRYRRRVQWLAHTFPDGGLPALDDASIAARLADWIGGMRSLSDVRGADWLSLFREMVGGENAARVERMAPASLELPSGNRVAIEYAPGRPPHLAVRIQEFFSLRETPRIAEGRIAVNLHLLAPNGRPQQITDDLAGFWTRTYPQVKKELRRRYPKHAWPDDPLAARATRSGLTRDLSRDP